MKRLHLHVSVDDLDQAVGFYTRLFDAEPVKLKSDYAQWLLDDPRVNFAISTRGRRTGLDHVGIQVDEDRDAAAVAERLAAAGAEILREQATTCCYARSSKHWVNDPAGIPWEVYHTLADAPVYGTDRPAVSETASGACCTPAALAGEKPGG
ncbi:MAG TPA: ArsI/CadI family heavy metal resistance metalloenzyme [Gammaproteobacteria bacterium]|nr:ArsI/CadI family heavy metal resistance metalloenzyme [Gammaproteobacteria bacterium]